MDDSTTWMCGCSTFPLKSWNLKYKWLFDKHSHAFDNGHALVTTVLPSLFNMLLPFFGRPLPFPSRDFLSSSLLLGLVGATEVPLTTSPLSLSESPLPESLEEFFLSLRLALAFRRASWMLLLEEATQLPLISLLIFLLEIMKPPLSSSPDTIESLRSPTSSVGLEEKIVVSSCLVWFDRN